MPPSFPSSSSHSSNTLFYSQLPTSTASLHSQLKQRDINMSGVWVFRDGVMRLVGNPASESDSNARRKVLVHQPTDEVITSYASLHHKLTALGWERYYDNPDLIQYHKRSSVDLISLPRNFNNFQSFHLFDIVVKTHSVFEVRDI